MVAQTPTLKHSPPAFPLNSLKKWLPALFRKSENGDRTQPSFLGHCVLATLLSGVFMGGYALQVNRSATRLNNWLNPTAIPTADVMIERLDSQIEQMSQHLEEAHESEDRHTIEINLAEKTRLKVQLLEIDKRLTRYSDMMIYFYSRNNASISLTTLSALLAGSCVLLISRMGWEKVNNVVIHGFLFSSGCVLLFSDISGIFQYDANYQTVKSIYTEHMTLKNAIHSFLATEGFIRENPDGNIEYVGKQDTNRFIYYVDQQLAKFNQIPVDIDASTLQQVVNAANVRNQLGEGVSFELPSRAEDDSL